MLAGAGRQHFDSKCFHWAFNFKPFEMDETQASEDKNSQTSQLGEEDLRKIEEESVPENTKKQT